MGHKILVVMPPNRRSELLRQLDGRNCQIILASNVTEAMRKLASETSFDLVLADCQLVDGSWRDLLHVLVDSTRTCELIVCARYADETLWADVLQCGAYDLIVEPYEQQEVNRIIQNAIESQHLRRFAHMATVARAS